MYDGEKIYNAAVQEVTPVEIVGSGDAFMGGLIYGFKRRAFR
jgi:2-dehydro-3-deoxygluconokinase